MEKQEMLNRLVKQITVIEAECAEMSPEIFFMQQSGKWSVAENLQHLILSVKPLNQALPLPKFIFRIFGKPNNPSRTYEEMLSLYKQKLSNGGKSSSPYIPKEINADKDKVIQNFINAHLKFQKAVAGFSEEDMDKYLVPHPLLGKLTVREMIYFTLFHILHHHSAVKQLALKTT